MMMTYARHVARLVVKYVAIALALCCMPYAYASASDDIPLHRSGGNPANGFKVYASTHTQAYAQRYSINALLRLDSVAVWLIGGKGSSGVVHVYGNEGNANVPTLEQDLIEPVRITKKANGLERLVVPIVTTSFIDVDQIFIAVDSLSSGASLVTTSKAVVDTCRFPYGTFTSQCIRTYKNGWSSAPFSFLVDIFGVTRMIEPVVSFQADTLHRGGKARTTFMVAHDIDGDGSPEVLTPLGFFTQHAVTKKLSLVRNSDSIARRIDAIVPVLGPSYKNSHRLVVLSRFDLANDPVAMSVFRSMGVKADVVMIDSGAVVLNTGCSYDDRTATTSILAVVNHRSRSVIDEILLTNDSVARRTIWQGYRFNAAEITDVGADGKMDVVGSLVIDSITSKGILISNVGHEDESVTNIDLLNHRPLAYMPHMTYGLIADDVREPSLVVASSMTTKDLSNAPGKQSVFAYRASQMSMPVALNMDFGYREGLSRVVRRDIDNDGWDDMIALTQDTCHAASIYMQHAGNSITWERARSSGLEVLSGCSSIAWADCNADNKIDAIGYRDGMVFILTNTTSALARKTVQRQGSIAQASSIAAEDGRGLRYWSGVWGHSANVYDTPEYAPDEYHGSSVMSADGADSSTKISITPSVISSTAMVELSNASAAILGISLYDIGGAVIGSVNIQGRDTRFALNLDDLSGSVIPSGTYRILVRTTVGEFSERIVVVR